MDAARELSEELRKKGVNEHTVGLVEQFVLDYEDLFTAYKNGSEGAEADLKSMMDNLKCMMDDLESIDLESIDPELVSRLKKISQFALDVMRKARHDMAENSDITGSCVRTQSDAAQKTLIGKSKQFWADKVWQDYYLAKYRDDKLATVKLNEAQLLGIIALKAPSADTNEDVKVALARMKAEASGIAIEDISDLLKAIDWNDAAQSGITKAIIMNVIGEERLKQAMSQANVTKGGSKASFVLDANTSQKSEIFYTVYVYNQRVVAKRAALIKAGQQDQADALQKKYNAWLKAWAPNYIFDQVNGLVVYMGSDKPEGIQMTPEQVEVLAIKGKISKLAQRYAAGKITRKQFENGFNLFNKQIETIERSMQTPEFLSASVAIEKKAASIPGLEEREAILVAAEQAELQKDVALKELTGLLPVKPQPLPSFEKASNFFQDTGSTQEAPQGQAPKNMPWALMPVEPKKATSLPEDDPIFGFLVAPLPELRSGSAASETVTIAGSKVEIEVLQDERSDASQIKAKKDVLALDVEAGDVIVGLKGELKTSQGYVIVVMKGRTNEIRLAFQKTFNTNGFVPIQVNNGMIEVPYDQDTFADKSVKLILRYSYNNKDSDAGLRRAGISLQGLKNSLSNAMLVSVSGWFLRIYRNEDLERFGDNGDPYLMTLSRQIGYDNVPSDMREAVISAIHFVSKQAGMQNVSRFDEGVVAATVQASQIPMVKDGGVNVQSGQSEVPVKPIFGLPGAVPPVLTTPMSSSDDPLIPSIPLG